MQAKQLVILDDDKRFQHCKELLENRYLAFKIDTNGKKIITETPRDMFVRVAKFLANSEEEFAHFFDMMYNLDALPNSPTLWGANMQKTLLNACAVLEVRDSTEDIMEQMKNGVILQKLSSGVGYYFGDIRSRDALVQSSGGKALGAVAVMRMYNASFKEISQGGRRRGAFISYPAFILPAPGRPGRDYHDGRNRPGQRQGVHPRLAGTQARRSGRLGQLYLHLGLCPAS